jgi:hypothetical protein
MYVCTYDDLHWYFKSHTYILMSFKCTICIHIHTYPNTRIHMTHAHTHAKKKHMQYVYEHIRACRPHKLSEYTFRHLLLTQYKNHAKIMHSQSAMLSCRVLSRTRLHLSRMPKCVQLMHRGCSDSHTITSHRHKNEICDT